jgi:PhnB protein
MAVHHVPEGYHTVTPYLIVKGAEQLIEFAREGLGAEEQFRLPGEGGTIAHAEVRLGDSTIMLAEATEEYPATRSNLHLYVEDCDAVFRRAVAAGATVVQEVSDKFYGDRAGTVRDPFGNLWSISTHVEDVPADELERRMAAFTAGEIV